MLLRNLSLVDFEDLVVVVVRLPALPRWLDSVAVDEEGVSTKEGRRESLAGSLLSFNTFESVAEPRTFFRCGSCLYNDAIRLMPGVSLYATAH